MPRVSLSERNKLRKRTSEMMYCCHPLLVSLVKATYDLLLSLFLLLLVVVVVVLLLLSIISLSLSIYIYRERERDFAASFPFCHAGPEVVQDSSKGGAVEIGCSDFMMYTSLLYNPTPIHCTPLRLHPPLMKTQWFLRSRHRCSWIRAYDQKRQQ